MTSTDLPKLGGVSILWEDDRFDGPTKGVAVREGRHYWFAAVFDKEALEEEAWEDWKKSNIEECIVCGDEQHREELLWPCEHGYCDTCLRDGFKNALASKTPFKKP